MKFVSVMTIFNYAKSYTTIWIDSDFEFGKYRTRVTDKFVSVRYMFINSKQSDRFLQTNILADLYNKFVSVLKITFVTDHILRVPVYFSFNILSSKPKAMITEKKKVIKLTRSSLRSESKILWICESGGQPCVLSGRPSVTVIFRQYPGVSRSVSRQFGAENCAWEREK